MTSVLIETTLVPGDASTNTHVQCRAESLQQRHEKSFIKQSNCLPNYHRPWLSKSSPKVFPNTKKHIIPGPFYQRSARENCTTRLTQPLVPQVFTKQRITTSHVRSIQNQHSSLRRKLKNPEIHNKMLDQEAAHNRTPRPTSQNQA